MNLGDLIQCSIYSIFKLIFVAFFGFIASRKSGFDEKMRSVWSKLIFTYFMPATVFYQTATAINEINELKELWILPLGCFLHEIFQFYIPWTLAKIMKLERLDARVFTFTLGFSNVMYIPLAIVESLTSETDELGLNAKTIGFSYICTYQLTFMITFFVFGYNYINLNVREVNMRNSENIELIQIKVEEGEDLKEKISDDSHSHSKSSSSSDDSSSDEEKKENNQLNEKKEQKSNEQNENEDIESYQHSSNQLENSQNTQNNQNENSENTQEYSNTPFGKFKQKCHNIKETIIKPFKTLWYKLPEIVRFSLKNLCSIPTIAAICGIIFMLLKWIRDPLLVSGDLSIVGRCISYLGSCTVFCALFLLGGSLSNGPKGGNVPFWKIAIGLFFRMILIPIGCWVVTFLLYKYGILPPNKMMYFVLQIEAFAPPALNSLVVVNVCYPSGVNTSSSILFWCYMIAIISLTVDIIVTMTTL